MKIIQTSAEHNFLDNAVEVLRNGGLVVAPSDTVYGLLVDSTNESAVRKLLAFKNRPIGKPISIFLADVDAVSDQTIVSDEQKKLLKKFIPGPFTIILPSQHKVSKLLESERGTLGVRVINYPLITQLVTRYGKPLTATSANISGKKPHHSLDAFLATLSETKKELIDLILDAGSLPRNKPSTVVDLSGSDIKILRKGDIVVSSAKSFLSTSEEETKKIGLHLMQKNIELHRPLVFIIEGDLGVGKTILVKGIAEALNITNIISPTFVVYYEYPVLKSNFRQFVHADLYNIKETEEYNHLGFENYLQDQNVLCFEWGERMGELYETMRSKAEIIHITMHHISEHEREITIAT